MLKEYMKAWDDYYDIGVSDAAKRRPAANNFHNTPDGGFHAIDPDTWDKSGAKVGNFDSLNNLIERLIEQEELSIKDNMVYCSKSGDCLILSYQE